jgi:hypothetical protein
MYKSTCMRSEGSAPAGLHHHRPNLMAEERAVFRIAQNLEDDQDCNIQERKGFSESESVEMRRE